MILKYFRYLPFVLATLCLAACGDDSDNGTDEGGQVVPTPGMKGLTFDVSKKVIQSNGKETSDFIVKYDGQDITEGVTIYAVDGEDDLPVDNKKGFSTTESGEYKFWAAYKSKHTETVTIKAVSVPVPQLPQDKAPERTDFTKRVLLTQFTGTGCPYCPLMTTCMREAFSDPTYADKAIFCVAHTFNITDPGYLHNDPLAQAFGVSAFPTLNIDFISAFSTQTISTGKIVQQLIDQAYNKYPAEAGICAKAEVIEEDSVQKIVLHVAVKASEEGEYNVGAWLMEDSIKAKQQVAAGIHGDFNTHNNTLRVVDSKSGYNNYTGIHLGKIAKGKTAEHVFVMNLKEKWVLKNCHMALFVTKNLGRQSFVTNAVRCPIQGIVDYDYKK